MRDRTTLIAVAVVALLAGSVFGAGLAGQFSGSETGDRTGSPLDDRSEASLSTFDSDAAFEAYVEPDRSTAVRPTISPTRIDDDDLVVEQEAFDVAEDDAAAAPSSEPSDAGDPQRHSETNVQEAGIDEPDALKTDGESVYYAGVRYASRSGETTVVDVSDPAEPVTIDSIPIGGELLLVEDTLVVLGDDRAAGYDVSDPTDPAELWQTDLEAAIDTARLSDGDLYLVLVDEPGTDPCPMEPFGDRTIECTDIVRPDAPADADVVYTAMRVDPETGDVESETSAVGSESHSATYVSEDAIYLSYTRSTSEYQLTRAALTGDNASEILDDDTHDRIVALDDLDISDRAKEVELDAILDDWLAGLDEDERRDARQELDDAVLSYVEENQRELTRTGIIRIDTDGELTATGNGEVPGYPLNQFSMDEHDDHLRLATTIPRTHGADSENDVYVLDSELETVGSVTGLGIDQRVYSVRFEGDEGYVVTFRQIDPFYTLDLSDPAEPAVEGALKLPGYSDYLHPLEDDLVLGVGEQQSEPKLSLFDVNDREEPTVADSELLDDERYSEVSRTHTAFLQDEDTGVFFIPGTDNSYVFDYEDGDLDEVARVDVGGTDTRAMYVGDYLYVFGDDEAIVLDQTTWDETTRLEL